MATPAPASSSLKLRLGWRIGLAAAFLAVVVGLTVFLLVGSGPAPQQAIADAINLRQSDVPGFVAHPQSHSAAGSQIGSRLKRCVGNWNGDHPGSVEVDSPTFASGSGLTTQEVQSSVTIQRSRTAVAGDLALIRSGRIQACLGQALEGVTIPTSSGVPVTITDAGVASLPAVTARSDGSFGMRLLMTMEALGVKVPVSMDLFGYAVGRDELGLMTLAIGPNFPSQTEQQLSQLLVSRALGHPH